MDKKREKNLIVGIIWKPFFAALMTAILSVNTSLPPILIGGALGIAASAACYYDLNKYIEAKDKSDSAK